MIGPDASTIFRYTECCNNGRAISNGSKATYSRGNHSHVLLTHEASIRKISSQIFTDVYFSRISVVLYKQCFLTVPSLFPGLVGRSSPPLPETYFSTGHANGLFESHSFPPTNSSISHHRRGDGHVFHLLATRPRSPTSWIGHPTIPTQPMAHVPLHRLDHHNAPLRHHPLHTAPTPRVATTTCLATH